MDLFIYIIVIMDLFIYIIVITNDLFRTSTMFKVK